MRNSDLPCHPMFRTMYILHGNIKVHYSHKYAQLYQNGLIMPYNGIQVNYANYASIDVINYYLPLKIY